MVSYHVMHDYPSDHDRPRFVRLLVKRRNCRGYFYEVIINVCTVIVTVDMHAYKTNSCSEIIVNYKDIEEWISRISK